MCQLSTLESRSALATDEAEKQPKQAKDILCVKTLVRYVVGTKHARCSGPKHVSHPFTCPHKRIFLRCVVFLLTLLAPILSLMAVGSSRVWHVAHSTVALEYNASFASTNGTTFDARTSSWLPATAPLQSATFGYFAWDPDHQGCRWYNDDSSYDTSPLQDNPFWNKLRTVALVTAILALLAVSSVSVELCCCRYFGGRLISAALILLTTLGHCVMVVMQYYYLPHLCAASQAVLDATLSSDDNNAATHDEYRYTCSRDSGAHLAAAAIAVWIVTLLAACTAPKARPLARVVMELEHDSDTDDPPYCAMVGCCAQHLQRRRSRRQLKRLSSSATIRPKKKGWSITIATPPVVNGICVAPDIAYGDQNDDDNVSGSSSEPDQFFDVDRDFVGHEIVVCNNDDDSLDEEAALPFASVPSRPKEQPVLFPLKTPTVKPAPPDHVAADKNERQLPRYSTYPLCAHKNTFPLCKWLSPIMRMPSAENGEVVDNDLFFDTLQIQTSQT
jgi:hypothetical protein